MRTSPICRQDFYGRTELLALIERRALELAAGYRQNLALLGPERIGKTSVLLKSAEIISKRPLLMPVYMELKPGMTLPEFIRQFGATLLYQYGATQGRSMPDSFQQLCAACRPFIPETVLLLTQAVAKSKRSPAAALEKLFEAPGRLRRESGRLCVMMLDEFHRLGSWEKASAVSALGRQVMVQQETMYLLASSSVEEARTILREGLALLFGHFEVVPVRPFDLSASVGYLTEQAADVFGEGNQEALIAFADLFQGSPHRLNAWARLLKERADVSAALAGLILHSDGAMTQEYERRIGEIPEAFRERILQILLAVAQGQHRVSALGDAEGWTPSAARRSLRWLCEAGWVVREGGFVYLPDRLFCFWIRLVYPIRHGLVQVSPETMEQWFSQEVCRWLKETIPQGPQDVLELLTGLLKRFQNDVLEFHQRRIRLPKMEVHTLLLPGLPRSCVAHREDASWFCIPYTAHLTESDAIRMVQALRQVSKPWKRRIVVAIQGLEVNARLYLQEHKFWVWELDDLNHLLDLYGLPRLMPKEISTSTVTEIAPAPDTEIVAPIHRQATA